MKDCTPSRASALFRTWSRMEGMKATAACSPPSTFHGNARCRLMMDVKEGNDLAAYVKCYSGRRVCFQISQRPPSNPVTPVRLRRAVELGQIRPVLLLWPLHLLPAQH